MTRSIHSRNGFPVIITRVEPRVLKVLLGVKPDFKVHSDADSLDQTVRCKLNRFTEFFVLINRFQSIGIAESKGASGETIVPLDD